MELNLVVDSALEPVLETLKALESLINAASDGRQPVDFDLLLAPEFWEVGATGKKYSRQFVIEVFDERQRSPMAEAWEATDFHVQELAPRLFLLTYTLHQASRITARSSLWRDTPDGWKLVYHQGTVVEAH